MSFIFQDPIYLLSPPRYFFSFLYQIVIFSLLNFNNLSVSIWYSLVFVLHYSYLYTCLISPVAHVFFNHHILFTFLYLQHIFHTVTDALQ